MSAELYNALLRGKTTTTPSKRSGLNMISLKEFLYKYGEELYDYYGEDFFVEGDIQRWLNDTHEENKSRTIILCMVDLSESDHHIVTKKGIKKKMRKAGAIRRRRIKHRYSYENPMNRIHGYIILTQENIRPYPERKVISIPLIVSSPFSDKRGIGSDMMDIIIQLTIDCKFDDIILEVSNEYAWRAYEDDQSESESEEEYESESESEYGSEEEFEEDWYPTEEVLDIISHELWRKSMRKANGEDTPYYNIGEDYVYSCIKEYFNADDSVYEEGKHTKHTQKRISEDPKDNEYGGYWYQKGKKSQMRLMKFYEKFGFIEDPSIYLEWDCYDKNPFPTMRRPIK